MRSKTQAFIALENIVTDLAMKTILLKGVSLALLRIWDKEDREENTENNHKAESQPIIGPQ
jgi:hypothetical protein